MCPFPPYLRVGLLFLFFLATGLTSSWAQSTGIVDINDPAVVNHRDMVFDRAGKYLYVSTAEGYVQRLNLTTGQLEAPYNLGGSLNGIDIAPDDSFLLVAQNNSANGQATVHRIDLINGAITNINYPLDSNTTESGAWAIAIGSNGLALVTPVCNESYWGPVRQIDLATNTVTSRNDVPSVGDVGGGAGHPPYVGNHTHLHRSADRSRFYFLEGHSNYGPVFTYDAVTNSFSHAVLSGDHASLASAAVNRDGTKLITRHRTNASLDSAADCNFLHAFHQVTDSGVAFDAVNDTLYVVNSASATVVAFDTNTYQQKFTIPPALPYLGYGNATEFGVGTLVASPDGRFLAFAGNIGVRLFDLSQVTKVLPSAPLLTDPRDVAFDTASTHLYISTGDGVVFRYNLATGYLDMWYQLGGSLGAIDITPDDSYLLVIQEIFGIAEAGFHKLNLNNGAITNINYTRYIDEGGYGAEGGALDVAIASNGKAIVTTDSQQVPSWRVFRQIDLATDTVTVRSDTPPNAFPAFTYPASAQLYPSADRSMIYCLQTTDASEAYNYYSSRDQFGPVNTANEGPETGAANRDGTLIAHRAENQPTVLQTASSFSVVHSFSGLDDGLAFNATSDVFYGVSTATDEIIGYNTNTFAEVLRLPIGEDMPTPFPPFYRLGAGRLVTSHNGRYVALITPTAVRLYDVTAPTAATPTVTPSGGTFKKKVLVKLSCATPGATIFYTLDGSMPTTSSPVYTTSKKVKGITITGKGPHTLKAMAAENGYNLSAVVTANFTIK
jgi:hypothetical protein